jgi:8-oxo-dGTP pyrophosphatase MutT (NUDIX family)
MNYENPTPVAVNMVRVLDSDLNVIGLLGIERGIEPQLGGLAMPGGYVDKLESIEQAASREFAEEVGISFSPSMWRLSHSEITATNRVLIFCEAIVCIPEPKIAELKPNREVRRFCVLTRESKLCFPLHQKALDAYFNKQVHDDR